VKAGGFEPFNRANPNIAPEQNFAPDGDAEAEAQQQEAGGDEANPAGA
jgi:hypothetical protein